MTLEEMKTAPLSKLLKFIFSSYNEVAIGWNDCYCQWLFSYGCRGAGSMTDNCGKRIFVEAPSLKSACKLFIKEIILGEK